MPPREPEHKKRSSSRAQESLQPPAIAVNDRICVRWNPSEAHEAQVVGVEMELGGTYRLRAKYSTSAGGRCLPHIWHARYGGWYGLDSIEVLPPETFDGVEADEWRVLPLRCRVSGARLTEPARGEACAHLPCCNYRALCSMVSRTKQCPVDGCGAPLARSRAVQRDEALSEQLRRVPADVDSVRQHSRTCEVQWDAPRLVDESNMVDLTSESEIRPDQARLESAVKSEA